MTPLKLRSSVQERYASLIRPGLPVKFAVESFPGESFEGKVAYVSPAVDQATRTFPVEVLVNNSDRKLKPGFFAKGVIHTRIDENVLAVPEEAISTLAGVSTVYIIENGKVRQQIVALGSRDIKTIEIVSGLKGDEVLASSNLNQLATGVTVEVADAGRIEPGRERSAGPQDQGARP
jgi:RND family efflux transporter MFP subunit